MAWYYGTYSCGHEGRVNITGPGKEKEWKKDREFSGLCPECREKKKAEERERKNKESAEKSKEMKLPDLTGSIKQVAWANSLRLDKINRIINFMEQICVKDKDNNFLIRSIRGEKISLTEDEVEECLDYMIRSKTEASFWIDKRNVSCGILFTDLAIEYKSIKKNDIYTEEKEEIEEEKEIATVVPETKNKKPGVAVIDYNSGKSVLSAMYIKDPDFIEIVKNLGYEWNGTAWCKNISEYTGSYNERSAELGNKLLRAGFSVQFPNSMIKEKAINGDFSEENDRWIKFMKSTGRLAIMWMGKNDVLYQAAKKIPGAKWEKGYMIVNIEFYSEIEDFADTMGFCISQMAKEKIEEYRKKEKVFEIVSPATPNNNHMNDENRIAKYLKTNGTVIEDLKDET